MHALALIWAVVAPLLLGLPALDAIGIRGRDDRLGRWAWAWMVGCLLLAALVQVAVVLALPAHVFWLLPPLPAFALAVVGCRRSCVPDAAGEVAVAPAPCGAWFAAAVVAVALVATWFALAGMDRPCVEGDEGNIWSLKAKSLLVDYPTGFAAAQVHNLHPDYPQLDPLLQTWVYALTGVPDFVQFENRWPIQLCDVALLLAVAAALRRRLAPLPAVTLLVLVALEPEFLRLCRTAYADGMVALGLVVAHDGYLRWRQDGSRAYAWLAGLGLAFALWSKNESMLYLASLGGAAALTLPWRRPRRLALRGAMPLLPAAVVVAFTTLWNRGFGLPSDLFGANPTGKSMFALMAEQWPERVPAMFAEAMTTVFAIDHSHAVLALLPLAIVAAPRLVLGSHFAIPALALVFGVVGIHVVYVGSFLPLRFHLDTSYLRVLFQLLPAGVVLLGAIGAEVVAGRGSGQTARPA